MGEQDIELEALICHEIDEEPAEPTDTVLVLEPHVEGIWSSDPEPCGEPGVWLGGDPAPLGRMTATVTYTYDDEITCVAFAEFTFT